MISLVFLVCSVQGQCFTASSQLVFRDQDSCKSAAEMTISQNLQQDRDAGRLPKIAVYQCLEWGTAS